jgi:hypothetical protein
LLLAAAVVLVCCGDDLFEFFDFSSFGLLRFSNVASNQMEQAKSYRERLLAERVEVINDAKEG